MDKTISSHDMLRKQCAFRSVSWKCYHHREDPCKANRGCCRQPNRPKPSRKAAVSKARKENRKESPFKGKNRRPFSDPPPQQPARSELSHATPASAADAERACTHVAGDAERQGIHVHVLAAEERSRLGGELAGRLGAVRVGHVQVDVPGTAE